jgi:hypothetical protein
LWHSHKLRLIKGRQRVFIKVLPSFRGDSNLSAFRNRIICVDMGQCKCWSTAWILQGNVKFIFDATHTHTHLPPQLRTDIPILVFRRTERGICHPMRLADKDSSIQPSHHCYYPNPSGKSTLCKIFVHAQQRLPSCSFTTSWDRPSWHEDWSSTWIRSLACSAWWLHPRFNIASAAAGILQAAAAGVSPLIKRAV